MTIAGKTYRIKSRSRFTMFIMLVIILFIAIASSVSGQNDASGLTQPEYIEIEVNHGDTLWHIAKTYMPDHNDIRKSVHMICGINGIKADELRAGQTLLIPANM